MPDQDFPPPPPGFGLGPSQPASSPVPQPASGTPIGSTHEGSDAVADLPSTQPTLPAASTLAGATQATAAAEHGYHYPWQAVAVCLRRYVGFGGRANRSEFWWFACFYYAVMALATVIDAQLGYHDFATNTVGVAPQNGPAASVLSLALILPLCAAFARRLHDVGRSGWSWLWSLTVIGLIFVVVWLATDGGPNFDNGRGIRT